MSKKKMSKKIKSIQSIADAVFSKLFGQKAIKRLNQFVLFCEHDDKRMKVTTLVEIPDFFTGFSWRVREALIKSSF